MPPRAKSRMDAESYLKKQGWRGTGHSLDHTDRGIKKPLLIAHKQDQNGLGHKKAAHKTDDQWWMRAFDESLQNIGTGKESTLAQVRKQGINRGGLYGFFVKGEGLVGTIGVEDSVSTSTLSATASVETSSANSRATTPPPTSIDTPGDSGSKKRKRESKSDKEEAKRLKKEKKEKKQKREDTAAPEGSRKRKRAEVAAVSTEAEDEAAANATKVLTRINRDVKKELKKQEKAGKFGSLPPKQDSAWRESKLAREKVMREAEKDVKRDMVADAVVKGDLPNPKAYTKDQILEKYDDIMGEIRKVQEAAKQRKNDAKNAPKVEQPDESRAGEDTKKNIEVAARISKLSEKERKQYAERAKAKGQTLEQYVLRRIEKKGEKSKDGKSSETPEAPLVAEVKKATKVEKKEIKVRSKKAKTVKVSAEVAVAA